MDPDRDQSDWAVTSSAIVAEPIAPSIFSVVYRLYRENFWAFYAISLPPALFAIFVNIARNVLIDRIFGEIQPFQPIPTSTIIGSVLVNFSCFYIVWFLESFAFAAICSKVMDESGSNPASTHDGYMRPRERIGAVLYVAFATFLRFAVLFAIVSYFVIPAAFRVLPRSVAGNQWFPLGMGAATVLAISAAIMGYAFAIPIVIRTDMTGHQAMRRSWRLTDGHEGTLFRLIVESLLSGVAAAYAAFWIAFVVLNHFELSHWAGWVQAVVTALIAAAVQVPMFIGFALEYQKAAETKQTDAAAG